MTAMWVPVKKKAEYDYTTEQLHWEGPPHRGDLALNLALAPTLLWLPLTFAAIGRAAFMQYRFTDLRLSVTSTAPWKGTSHAGGLLLLQSTLMHTKAHVTFHVMFGRGGAATRSSVSANS